MTDYVLTGLTKRRAELTGEIEALHERLSSPLADLENLDRIIVQFAPDFHVETIKPKAFRPPQDWSHRGTMSRVVLSIIRQATEPLTTRDIAVGMLITRALDKDDQKLLRLMTKRVGVALRTQWAMAPCGLSRGRVNLCCGRWHDDSKKSQNVISESKRSCADSRRACTRERVDY